MIPSKFGPNGAAVPIFVDAVRALTDDQWITAVRTHWEQDGDLYLTAVKSAQSLPLTQREATVSAIEHTIIETKVTDRLKAIDGLRATLGLRVFVTMAGFAIAFRDRFTEEQFACMIAPREAVGIDCVALSRSGDTPA